MSIKVMNLVWGSTLDGAQKRFVLLALADTGDDKGKCATLSVPKLCQKTGIKRSTVFVLLRELETVDSLIRREEQTRANGSRRVSLIWINVSLLKTMQRPDADQDDDEQQNPFDVSAGRPTVQLMDGGRPGVVHSPVHDRDPQAVQKLDGGRPDLGPLIPSSISEKDPETDGRTSTTATDEHQHLAARIVAGLDLRRCDPSPRQRGGIVNAVAAALARGVAAPVAADHARRKAGEAKTCTYLVKAFSAEHLAVDAPAVTAPAAGEPCGQCDARTGDGIAARQTTDADGRAVKCSNCHPHAIGGAQ